MKRILLTEPMHPAATEAAAGRDDVEIVQAPSADPARLREFLGDAHAIGVRISPLPAELLALAPQLEVVSRHGVGCDNVDVAHLTARGIPVAIAAGANAAAVAEHSLMLMLAAARGLLRLDRVVRTGRFDDRDGLIGGDLHGTRALIIGFGRTGRETARRCRAFGMAVTVADPAPDRALAETLGCKVVADFRPELPAADFLSLHAPLEVSTRAMLSDAEFARIKPGAILINCARGGLVDEAALLRALDTGRVAMAGMDVFDPEPPTADNRLLSHENVILTPHMAAATQGAMREMARMTVANILDYFDGKLDRACIFNWRELSRRADNPPPPPPPAR